MTSHQLRFHRFARQVLAALVEITKTQTSMLPLLKIRRWSCPRPRYPHAPVPVHLLPMHLLVLPTRATPIPLHVLPDSLALRVCYKHQHHRLRYVGVIHMTRCTQRCTHHTFPNLRRHLHKVSLPFRGLNWAMASTSERADSTVLQCIH